MNVSYAKDTSRCLQCHLTSILPMYMDGTKLRSSLKLYLPISGRLTTQMLLRKCNATFECFLLSHQYTGQ